MIIIIILLILITIGILCISEIGQNILIFCIHWILKIGKWLLYVGGIILFILLIYGFYISTKQSSITGLYYLDLFITFFGGGSCLIIGVIICTYIYKYLKKYTKIKSKKNFMVRIFGGLTEE